MYGSNTFIFCLHYVDIKHFLTCNRQRLQGSWKLFFLKFSGWILLPFCQVLKRSIHRREPLDSVSSHSPSAVQNHHAEPFSCCCNMQRKATKCGPFPVSSYISEHRPGLHFNSCSMCLCFNSDLLSMYQIRLKKTHLVNTAI